jgi:hypothetical protein
MYYSISKNFTYYDFFQAPKIVLRGGPLYITAVKIGGNIWLWKDKVYVIPTYNVGPYFSVSFD